MTDPVVPTPVAPEGIPAPPVPTPPPVATPPAPAPTTFDPSALAPEAQAYLKAQIDAADLKARTGSKANAAAEARAELTAKLAQSLGLVADEPPTPEVLSQHLEAARDQAWRTSVELNVFRSAGSADIAEKLLDSRAFVSSLEGLVDLDPESAAFRAGLAAKVQEAAARFPVAPAGQAPGLRPDPSMGSRGGGPTVDSRIAAAQAAGDWRTVISLQNQKLTPQ